MVYGWYTVVCGVVYGGMWGGIRWYVGGIRWYVRWYTGDRFWYLLVY